MSQNFESSSSLARVNALANRLSGQTAWNAQLGFGSFITIDFGERRLQNGKPIGEWHIWIYMATWRLQTSDTVLTASEDDRDYIKTIVPRISGRRLINIAIEKPALETTFAFENDLFLRVFPVYTQEDYDHWMLFTPDGQVLTIGPGNRWSYEPAAKGDDVSVEQ